MLNIKQGVLQITENSFLMLTLRCCSCYEKCVVLLLFVIISYVFLLLWYTFCTIFHNNYLVTI